MPRDIGPDMLRNLDEQLAAGNIDLARYEARKVEVVELIRRGKAIEYSGGERLWRIGRGVLAILLGVFLIAGSSGGLGGLLGLVLVGLGIVLAIQGLRS